MFFMLFFFLQFSSPYFRCLIRLCFSFVKKQKDQSRVKKNSILSIHFNEIIHVVDQILKLLIDFIHRQIHLFIDRQFQLQKLISYNLDENSMN